jgi:CubicO group peptidase (beta-lactamase class C family)
VSQQILEAFPVRTSLEEAGVSEPQLARFFAAITEQHLDLNSLLLLKGGKLAFEYYAYPYGPNIPRASFSAIKAFIALAVGITVDQGRLDVDECLLDIFPEYPVANPSANLQRMTVRHLLTSSTGHDGPALHWFPDDCDNIVTWFLQQDVPFLPGERCRYENPCFLILSYILIKRNGCPVQQFLEDELFSKIGMGKVGWSTLNPDDIILGIQATPRDYARIGLLCQQYGRWGTEQLISEQWLRTATSKQVPYPEGRRANWYGYLLWCDNIGGFSASGDHGQRILVLPDHDLVVVMTGTEPQHGKLYDALVECLFGEEGHSSAHDVPLDDVLTTMSPPIPHSTTLPNTAYDISGRRYTFAPQQYSSPAEWCVHFDGTDMFWLDLRNPEGRQNRLRGALDGTFHIETVSPENIFGFRRNTHTETEVAVRGQWTADTVFECDIRPLRYGMAYHYVLTVHEDGVHLFCQMNRRTETLHSLA